MARRRLISPEFFTHSGLFDAEQESRLPLRVAFAGLWTVCDRRGLFDWKPRELRLAILPYDDVHFPEVLEALERHGFVVRYVVDGKEYGRIPSFADWQTFHPHEKPSKTPEPPAVSAEPTIVRSEPDKVRLNNAVVSTVVTSTPTPTKKQGVRGADAKPNYSPEFETWWALYPKRAGGNSKHDAWNQFQARLRAGETFQAMLDGLKRYRAYCEATQKVGSDYVMQAVRFLGKSRQYLETWEIPKAQPRTSGKPETVFPAPKTYVPEPEVPRSPEATKKMLSEFTTGIGRPVPGVRL